VIQSQVVNQDIYHMCLKCISCDHLGLDSAYERISYFMNTVLLHKFTILKINKKRDFPQDNELTKMYTNYPFQNMHVFYFYYCVLLFSIQYFTSVCHCKLISYSRCSVNYLAHIDLYLKKRLISTAVSEIKS